MRGILDDYVSSDEETVDVHVRIEHTTRNAIQVSQDRGQSVCWIPRDAISYCNKESMGPGDFVILTISEKLAEQKELL